MNNENVAHAWAHNRDGHSGNLHSSHFSDADLGMTTYLNSYSTTVAIKLVDLAILPWRRSWSVTTSRHLSHAFRALPGGRVLYLDIFDQGRGRSDMTGRLDQADLRGLIINALIDKIKTCDNEYPKATVDVRLHLIVNVTGALELLGELAAKGKPVDYDASTFKGRLGMPDAVEMVNIKGVLKKYHSYYGLLDETRAEAAAFLEAKEKREAELLAIRRKKDAEKFALWLAGAAVPCPDSYKSGGAFLRLTAHVTPHPETSRMVETSLGVRFPLSDLTPAFRLYDRLNNGDGSWTPWHHNGEKVIIGGFNLVAITEQGGAVAGCHRVSREEIERFRATIAAV